MTSSLGRGEESEMERELTQSLRVSYYLSSAQQPGFQVLPTKSMNPLPGVPSVS